MPTITTLLQLLSIPSVSADEDDLSEVRSALLPIASRWKEVGIELKLKLADLDTIQATHRNSPEDCLTNAVSRWLRKGYNISKHGPPTWRKLVHAILVDAGARNPALAEKLPQDHLGTICILHRCTKLWPDLRKPTTSRISGKVRYWCRLVAWSNHYQ